MKHGLARAKRVKLVRSELNKVKRNLVNASQIVEKVEDKNEKLKTDNQSEMDTEHTDQTDGASQSDGENEGGRSSVNSNSAGIL